MKSPRLITAQALVRCEKGGYSQLVLDSAIRDAKLEPRDAAFVTALFYSVLERLATLDFVIEKYSRHTLTLEVRAVLRSAVCQLLYMPSVSTHAVVDEAVKCTKALKQTSASGMVNGILRSFLRDKLAIPPTKGETQELSVNYSCSMDVANMFINWLGYEGAKTALENALGRPPVFARVNILKATQAEVLASLKLEKVEAIEGMLSNSIEVFGDAAHTNSHNDGLFFIQDLSAQKAAMLLEAKPNERVLDLCAAPGSKAFLIAQEMENQGEIVCCDLYEGRLKLVDKGAERLGIDIISTKLNDGAVLNNDLGVFDRVICDVPCSGLGVIRRKPELKYRNCEAVANSEELSYKILSNGADYCKLGAVLLYGTCTVNPLENEGVSDKFLANHKEFSPYPFDGQSHVMQNSIGENRSDGFFIARFKKTGEK